MAYISVIVDTRDRMPETSYATCSDAYLAVHPNDAKRPDHSPANLPLGAEAGRQSKPSRVAAGGPSAPLTGTRGTRHSAAQKKRPHVGVSGRIPNSPIAREVRSDFCPRVAYRQDGPLTSVFSPRWMGTDRLRFATVAFGYDQSIGASATYPL